MLDTDPRWPTALLDFPDGPTAPRRQLHFGTPRQWLVAHDIQQVKPLLQQVQQLSEAGHWCLGWVSYEAAPAFQAHLPVKAPPPGFCYAVWAVFDHAHAGWPAPVAGADARTPAAFRAGAWTPDRASDQAMRSIERIHELIRQGEVYQVNLTQRLHASLAPNDTASLHHLFRALHQQQPHGYAMMLDARAATRSPGAVLSVSPELFFDWQNQQGNGQLTTQPMKGTAPRHADPALDAQAAQHLRQSDKERAENLMIVDLLRNDLSQLAVTGSVKVQSLFDVQALPTVWQMTSTITATTRPGTTLADVFTALFPCGSITGAPKARAMHHIALLEKQPRGVYCGAMGVVAPGGRATFNVPIRTVSVATPPPPAPWVATCGVGSGITLDAQATQELAEWQHKAVFLKRATHTFDLLESLPLANGTWPRLDQHLARLHRSAQHFACLTEAWPLTEQRIMHALQELALQHPQGRFKVRLLLSQHGHIHVQAQALSGPEAPAWATLPSPTALQALATAAPLAKVVLASHAMPVADDFIWHKTTERSAYQAFPPPPGMLDTLLFNAQGEITEFTIGNVAAFIHGKWVTPPVSCGLLPGVMRECLLKAGLLEERHLHVTELPHIQALALMNSVRGWIPVNLEVTA